MAKTYIGKWTDEESVTILFCPLVGTLRLYFMGQFLHKAVTADFPAAPMGQVLDQEGKGKEEYDGTQFRFHRESVYELAQGKSTAFQGQNIEEG